MAAVERRRRRAREPRDQSRARARRACKHQYISVRRASTPMPPRAQQLAAARADARPLRRAASNSDEEVSPRRHANRRARQITTLSRAPARRLDGRARALAILAGRGSKGGHVRVGTASASAWQRRVEAEVGRLWAESSRAADDADAQLKPRDEGAPSDVEKLASNLVGSAEGRQRKPSRRPSEAAPAPLPTRIVTTPGPRRVDWPGREGGRRRRAGRVPRLLKKRPAGGVCCCCSEAPR